MTSLTSHLMASQWTLEHPYDYFLAGVLVGILFTAWVIIMIGLYLTGKKGFKAGFFAEPTEDINEHSSEQNNFQSAKDLAQAAALVKIDLEVTYQYVRDTLEELTTAAGLPLTNEEGKPARNFQLVDNLTAHLRSR